MSSYRIALLPGDGIGPEIVEQAQRVLEAIAAQFNHEFEFQSCMIGGIAIDTCGDPLPQDTIDACKGSAAILLGAVGGPKWDDPTAKTRPEAGLLKIRKELGLFANLRPIQTFSELVGASPLRREIVDGTDILFFRELTGEAVPLLPDRAYSFASEAQPYDLEEVSAELRAAE